ncbi:MAG: hypothetical protein WC819_02800 [Parcubacteria group bacterium]|jgi:hypothetical protein
MVSGIGFKNTAVEDDQGGTPRKRTISRALLVSFGVLVVVIASYGLLKLWESSLRSESDVLDGEITAVNDEIVKSLSGETSDFAVRSHVMDKELYRGYDTNDIFQEIERIMIPRVVLKSFQHDSGAHEKKTVGTVSSTITGQGKVTITADSDTFDVMAQQIDVFKKSEYFENVKVGTTDRDDFGRIIFTLTMDVKPSTASPYDDVVAAVPDNVNNEVLLPSQSDATASDTTLNQ